MLAAGLYLDKKFISRTAKFFLHLQTAQMHRSPLVTKKKILSSKTGAETSGMVC